MDTKPNLADALQNALTDDPQAKDIIESVKEWVGVEAQRVSRKAARDAFNRLAETGTVSLVTKHDDMSTATVMMPLAGLAQLLVGVARSAQARAARPSLASMVEGLAPVDASEGLMAVNYDTGHALHDVPLAAERPGRVRRRAPN